MVNYSHSNFEQHIYKDPNFPIVLHFDTNNPNTHEFYLHWHEPLEILFFTNHQADVTIEAVRVTAKKGDVVVINSNHLHSLFADQDGCSYHCLIIDKVFCDMFSIPIEDTNFNELVTDPNVSELFKKIVLEMKERGPLYKTSVKSYVLELLVILCRCHCNLNVSLSDRPNQKKMSLVKKAISYIGAHFREKISVEEICSHIGFSKYYFCRTFKEVTGKTVVEYINILRCNHARKLLDSNDYNVSESAILSGFANMSYFTRLYKKLFGKLPSEK